MILGNSTLNEFFFMISFFYPLLSMMILSGVLFVFNQNIFVFGIIAKIFKVYNLEIFLETYAIGKFLFSVNVFSNLK